MRASGRGFACHWTCCEASALGCTCACYDEGICCEEVFGSSPQAFHCLSALEGISPGHHAVSAHIVVRTGMSRRQSIDMYVCASTSTVHACRCLLPQWPCPSTWACRPASPRTAQGSWSTACCCPSSMRPSSCSWRSALEGIPLQHCASCCPHGLYVTPRLSRNCLSWCSGHVWTSLQFLLHCVFWPMCSVHKESFYRTGPILRVQCVWLITWLQSLCVL